MLEKGWNAKAFLESHSFRHINPASKQRNSVSSNSATEPHCNIHNWLPGPRNVYAICEPCSLQAAPTRAVRPVRERMNLQSIHPYYHTGRTVVKFSDVLRKNSYLPKGRFETFAMKMMPRSYCQGPTTTKTIFCLRHTELLDYVISESLLH